MRLFGVVERAERAARVLLAWGVLGITAFPAGALAANVTLAWDPSTDPTVAGYNVYYGTTSHTYTSSLQAGNSTSLTVSNLTAGTYFFAATTYNIAGLESDYSQEVSYTVAGSVSNQPPTLDPLGAVALLENTSLQVNLTGISSGSTNPAILSISAFSSNPGLLPNPLVNYASPSTTGSLTLSPASNSYGSANITVMVDNGAPGNNTVIRSFTVSVIPVNNPPTLAPLPDLNLSANAAPQTVNLTGISSGDTNEVQPLTVTALSSNPALIPNPTVSYTSPNSSGTLTFAPVAGAYGSALITVIVNDGEPTNNLTTQGFTVTVAQPTVTPFTATVQPTSWTLSWQHTSGYVAQWDMTGTNRVSASLLQPSTVGTSWKIVGTADLNGDSQDELLFQHTSGTLAAWYMNHTNRIAGANLNPSLLRPSWQVLATGQLLGGPQKDLLMEDTNGWVGIWTLSGTNCTSQSLLNPNRVDKSWRIAAFGDLEGDGRKQIVLQNSGGWLGVWTMNGTNAAGFSYLNPAKLASAWKIVGTHDFNGDGRTDLILQHSSGWIGTWLMNGTNAAAFYFLNPPLVDKNWKISGPK